MYTTTEQPLAKRDIDSAKLSFVKLAREMHKADELNLEDILNSEEDLVE